MLARLIKRYCSKKGIECPTNWRLATQKELMSLYEHGIGSLVSTNFMTLQTTRSGYDSDRLVRIVKRLKERYGVAVYLEPGEAVAIRTGVLVATVLDVVENNGPIAILDTSATAHMPDVLEMPYRPEVVGAGHPDEKAYNYRLGGLTCLAGDMIGEYSFDHPLVVGERIVLLDMSHYTMVKTSNFNGVRLPSIVLRHQDGQYELVKQFGYEVYRDRLG
jgi:carboxynorspermidine decarboxylase